MRRNRLLRLLGASVMSICAIGGPVAATASADDDDDRRRHGGSNEIYVAPWGKDSWSGSKSRPYETVRRAQREVRDRTRHMRSDVVVNLLDGRHTLSSPLRLSSHAGDSGRNGHRVIWQAAGFGTHRQADPVLSGGTEIDRWRMDDQQLGIWKTEVGRLETRQLFVNGVRATRADLGGGLPGDVTTTAEGFVVDSAAPQSWERPEDIELASVLPPDLSYTENRCGVADISGNGTTTTIVMDQPCWQRALALHGVELGTSQAAPTDVENSKSFLDAPGEFYLDRSRRGRHVIYYIPRAGEDMRRADVVAPVLEALVEGVGTEDRALRDVTFRGITFAHTTWLEPNTPAGFVHEYASTYQIDQPPPDPLAQGGILSASNSIVPSSVSFDHTDGVVLQGNTFTALGADALLLARGSSNLVEGNIFTDVSSSAIVLNAPRIPTGRRGDALPLDPDEVARGNRVVNNWIHHIGVEYRGGNGMLVMAGKDTTIAHNQINDVPHGGISVFGDDPPELDPPVLRDSTEGLRIQNNKIADALGVLNDGGGIYTAGELGTSFDNGAEISGNVVTRQGPIDNFRVGIYTDWITNWAKVRENVSYGALIAAGGCAYYYIRNIEFAGNFWDRSAPTWFCLEFGVVENITSVNNTRLTGDPAQACAANPACASIVARAGLEPAYQHLLGGG